ncbi:SEL1-like repeat protein [Undibacterium sp. CY18W]|uniref:SEL1-like repeat protein n=1 Tax=Undibacterium hunanense TaxID=2762292 RepID=A0ABR6ZNL2_9BURK|nr:tetratricopeptide repeat protein [Undibacterium hunanense]MBC3917482.1 SEL1-like repeat protein [Undibacterium hunanense]
MSYLPSFFKQYELTRDADERDVKRAYAKALKKIDQENDPAGFQALRESYEHALQWLQNKSMYARWESVEDEIEGEAEVKDEAADTAAHENVKIFTHEQPVTPVSDQPVSSVPQPVLAEQEAEPATRLPPEVSEPEPDQPDTDIKPWPDAEALARIKAAAQANTPALPSPEAMAQAVFEQMRQQLLDTAATADHASVALEAALNDERLIQVEARHLFECSMARYLLAGWHAGDGELFDAALRQFEWNKDKQRLFSLDPRAFTLDRALTEMAVFDEKSKKIQNKQLALIRKARSDEFPGVDYLQINLPQMEQMLTLFPNWMSLVTKVGNIRDWRKTYNEMTQYRDVSAASDDGQPKSIGSVIGKPPAPAPNWLMDNKAISFCLLFAIIKLWSVFSGALSTNNYTQYTPQKPGYDHSKAAGLSQHATDYFLGRNGLQVNVDEAIKLWTQASDKGDKEASYQLGWLYFVGNKVEKNATKAHSWFSLAAEQGKESALVLVGDDLLNGEGVAKNPVEAFNWYKKAADKGSSIAQLKLATLYEKGIGVKANKAEAVKMLTLSAEQGQVGAESTLGQLYWFGQFGLKKDEDKAVLWLSRAAQKGNGTAQGLYGRAYELGVGGFSKQPSMAVDWYKKATKNYNKQAKIWLQQLCDKEKLPACTSAI